jgi:hypothetical protein
VPGPSETHEYRKREGTRGHRKGQRVEWVHATWQPPPPPSHLHPCNTHTHKHEFIHTTHHAPRTKKGVHVTRTTAPPSGTPGLVTTRSFTNRTTTGRPSMGLACTPALAATASCTSHRARLEGWRGGGVGGRDGETRERGLCMGAAPRTTPQPAPYLVLFVLHKAVAPGLAPSRAVSVPQKLHLCHVPKPSKHLQHLEPAGGGVGG